MIPRLNEELRLALLASGDAPLDVLDPSTDIHYVLVRRDQFERVRALFDSTGFTASERDHQLLAFGQRADWDDPELDAYEQFRPSNP